MGYNDTTILDVTANSTGDTYTVANWKQKHRFEIMVGATATYTLQGSADASTWETISTGSVSDVVNVNDYGYNYIRCNASGVSGGSVKAVWTWRE